MKRITMLLGLMLAAPQVIAAGVDAKQIYFGGGIGLNDIGYGDDAVGFQVFAGIPLPVNTDKLTLSAEVGYMDSGNFDRNVPFIGNVSTKATGLWAAAVASVPVQNNVSVIGRLGYDAGDDDGIMIGAGVGFNAGEKMEVRIEYVIRDTIDSLQANLVIRQ